MGPETPDLRCSDADRELTVGRLRVAAMEGRIDAEELSDRVAHAYTAKWCRELDALTADVTPPPAVASQALSRPVFVHPARRVNSLAIASLVFGFVWMVWMGSVAAVICGHVALRQIRASGGRETGKGFAVAGLALGYLGVLVLIVGMLSAFGREF